jgi:hypothetical protein
MASMNPNSMMAQIKAVTSKQEADKNACRAVFFEFDQGVEKSPIKSLGLVKSFKAKDLALSTLVQMGKMVDSGVITEAEAENTRTVVVEKIGGERKFVRRSDMAAAFTANATRFEAQAARFPKGHPGRKVPAILNTLFGSQEDPTAPMFLSPPEHRMFD